MQQPPQDIPRVMENTKKFGLEFLPWPGAGAGPGTQPRCVNPNGIAASSPRLPRLARLPWVNGLETNSTATRLRQPKSIPNVFLIPFNFMPAQQRPQFVLKTDLAMMLLLPGNVLLHCSRFDWLTEKPA